VFFHLYCLPCVSFNELAHAKLVLTTSCNSYSKITYSTKTNRLSFTVTVTMCVEQNRGEPVEWNRNTFGGGGGKQNVWTWLLLCTLIQRTLMSIIYKCMEWHEAATLAHYLSRRNCPPLLRSTRTKP
jgi:hypothetical protein